jgi:phosphocarrier protein FPr
MLLAPVRRSIRGKRSASAAWISAVEAMAAEWEALEDEYLRARAADLRSVGLQVLAHLLGVPVPRPRLEGPGILVASDLTPADAAGLDPALTLGVATAFGGPTSHAAILARSLGIPAVVGLGEGALQIAEGTALGLDGDAGLLYVEPSPDLAAELEERRRARAEADRSARAEARAPARTLTARPGGGRERRYRGRGGGRRRMRWRRPVPHRVLLRAPPDAVGRAGNRLPAPRRSSATGPWW